MNNQNQLWALYLGSVSAFGPKLDLKTIKQHKLWNNLKKDDYQLPNSVIFGVPNTNIDSLDDISKGYVYEYIKILYEVHNRRDLLGRVDKLVYNPNQDLIRMIQQFKLINYTERAETLKKAKGTKSKPLLEYIITNLDSLPKNNIYAYYLANAITLCRLSGLVGYLSVNEVLIEINKIAKIAHEKYKNYEEFALASQIGFKIHRSQLALEDFGLSIFSQSKVMLDLSCLVWPYLPWPEEFKIY